MPKYLLVRIKKSAYIAKLAEVGTTKEYWLITNRMPLQSSKVLLKELEENSLQAVSDAR